MGWRSPQSGTLPATFVDMLRDRAERQSGREAFLSLRYRSAEQPEMERASLLKGPSL
jgi:hypothetical protein